MRGSEREATTGEPHAARLAAPLLILPLTRAHTVSTVCWLALRCRSRKARHRPASGGRVGRSGRQARRAHAGEDRRGASRGRGTKSKGAGGESGEGEGDGRRTKPRELAQERGKVEREKERHTQSACIRTLTHQHPVARPLPTTRRRTHAFHCCIRQPKETGGELILPSCELIERSAKLQIGPLHCTKASKQAQPLYTFSTRSESNIFNQFFDLPAAGLVCNRKTTPTAP